MAERKTRTPKEAEPTIAYVDQEKIFEKRMNAVQVYQRLAMTIVSDPGPNSLGLGNMDFPSFFGQDSIGIIEKIHNGNLDALSLMGAEFNLLATVSDREDLVELTLLDVDSEKVQLRELSPEARGALATLGLEA